MSHHTITEHATAPTTMVAPWRGAIAALSFGALALLGTAAFAQEAFRPDLYFAGHTRSAGVIEAGAFGRETRFEGETRGRLAGRGAVTFDQVLRFSDGTRQTRRWVLRRTGPNTYSATANGVVGEARGVVEGRTLRLTYTLIPDEKTGPVEMDQTMRLEDDGVTVTNRATIGSGGFPFRTVTETFTRSARVSQR